MRRVQYVRGGREGGAGPGKLTVALHIGGGAGYPPKPAEMQWQLGAVRGGIGGEAFNR